MAHSFLRGVFRRTCYSAAILCLCAPAMAQTNAVHVLPSAFPTREMSRHAFTVNVNLVLVPVSVMDAMHHPVMGLQQSDFELFEGEVKQDIKYFYQQDAPISVALVLDTSGSMGKRMELLRDAVNEFLANANPLDDYTLITVSERPEVLLRGCRSADEIEATLGTVKAAGWTALLDAVRLATVALKNARYERKAILIVSDGLDNVSRHNLRDVASMVEESDADAYAIGIMDDALPFFGMLTERINRKLLTRITDSTGGRTVVANDLNELPRVAADLSREMRSEYVLGYRPPDGAHERKWRKIKVKLNAGEPELRAYYKKTYFTPGD